MYCACAVCLSHSTESNPILLRMHCTQKDHGAPKIKTPKTVKGMSDASCYISSLPEPRTALPSHSLHMPYQFRSKHLAFVGISDDDGVEVSSGGATEDVGMTFGGVVMVDRSSVEVAGFVSVIAGLS